MTTTINFSNKFNQLFLVALTLVCSLGFTYNVTAQASLAAENMISDIEVADDDGILKTYTVFRDERITDQWYYMPNEIRIAENIVNNEAQPKMKILKYQYQDDSKLTQQGGILVATFTYAMRRNVKEKVLDYLKKETGNSNARLSAIPFNSSEITFMSNSKSILGDSMAVTTFQGPTTANQEMVVTYKLDELGAAIIKGLATGKDGIGVSAKITYNGLTPPCGYTVKGEWDNVYKYFEERTKKEGGLNWWFIKAGATKSKIKKEEELEQISSIVVDQIGCDSSENSPIDARLAQIQDKIENMIFNKELLTKAKELEKLEAMLFNAKDKETKARVLDLMTQGNKKLQLGYQNSVKDVTKRQSGSINMSFYKKQLITRTSTFGGEIGFGKYNLDEETLLSEGYIVEVDANKEFPSVIFGLNDISESLNVEGMNLTITYTNSEGRVISEARNWSNSSKKWTTPKGENVDYLQFNLLGEAKETKKRIFNMTLEVNSNVKNGDFTIEKSVEIDQGERFVDFLSSLTEQYEIDGSLLSFSKLTEQSSDLLYAKVQLQKGDLKLGKNFKPFFTNGNAGPPSNIVFLFPKSDTPVSSKVTFFKKEKKTQSVTQEETIESADITLIDPDWPEEGE